MIPSIVNQLLREAGEKLSYLSETPLIEAEIVLAFILNITKEKLIISPPRSISASRQQAFAKLINKRASGLPLAYLIGRKEFYAHDFFVTPDVLIPRPESELIIETIKSLYPDKKNNFKLLEVGVGSGAIAISLALEYPQAKITATDISAQALKIAKINARKHKVNINFIRADLIKNIRPFNFDILIANLPYLPTAELNKPKNAATIGLKFEPKLALDGGQNGMSIYKNLLDLLPKTNNLALLLWEIDPRQSTLAKQMVQKKLKTSSITFIKDLAGLDRICVIKTNERINKKGLNLMSNLN